MPYEFSLYPQLVHIRWHGILVQEEVSALLVELPRLIRPAKELPPLLHTFEEVQALQLNHAPYFSPFTRSQSPFPSRVVRMALVTNRPMLLGVERLFQPLPVGPRWELQLFPNRPEAVDWLLSEPIEARFAAAQA